jgi:SAM-dependent methyltransferase
VPDVDPLVEVIYERRLYRHAEQMLGDPGLAEADRVAAGRARATCIRIGDRMHAEQGRLVEALRAVGLDVDPDEATGPRQNHTMRLRVRHYADADRVADRLSEEGFERWECWTDAAHESFGRFAREMTVARTTDVTTVVRIAWADEHRRNAVQRVFVPTAGDWSMMRLPRWAWPAYSLVRPVRLVGERLRLRRRYEDSLGPFLATPDTLLDPLLAFAGVDNSDLVVDIGCGDGRLVVAAAARLGCRALGIEHSPELVDLARSRARAAGVDDLVEIVHGDARSVDIGSATVVFMFLPIDVAAHLLGETLGSLTPRARLVVHEQMRLPDSIEPRPTETSALIGDDGVTVAHRWVAQPT